MLAAKNLRKYSRYYFDMITRIEVDEMGRYILLLPDDVVEDNMLEDGDTVTLEFLEDGIVEIHFV